MAQAWHQRVFLQISPVPCLVYFYIIIYLILFYIILFYLFYKSVISDLWYFKPMPSPGYAAQQFETPTRNTFYHLACGQHY